MPETHAGLTIAVALAAGVLGQSVARQLRIPGIVLLLALGAGLGPEGLGWVEPETLGPALFGIVDFAVAVVLFEGGLNLELHRLKRQELAIRQLITVGALVTIAGGSLAVAVLLRWPWELCLLFGSLIVVTGPTVVTPLLRELRLRPRLTTVLEAEGVLIDPIGAILAVLALQVALVPATETLATGLSDFVLRMGFGVGAGVIGGFLLGWLLRRRSLIPDGFENIFALASVILLFYGADHLVPYSGILAVTVAGVIVGNLDTPVGRELREFKDQLTVMLVGLLFILLAADIALADMRALGWRGATVVGILILVVRPLNAWISTRGSGLSTNEKVFIGWLAPRGIVAAGVASLTAVGLESQGISGGAEVRALVFLTIAGTVVLAGLTAAPVASLLRLRLPGRDRIAILGAQGLGLALANELRDAGRTVVFLDSDPRRCRNAEEAGYPVVFGDALTESTLLRAHIELVGTAVGLTFNDHLNSLFVGHVRKLFGVPHGYVSIEAIEGVKPPEHVKTYEGRVLFDGPHEQERWDVRMRHGYVKLERMTFAPIPKPDEADEGETPASEAAGTAGSDRGADNPGTTTATTLAEMNQDPYVILTVKRGERVDPMFMRFEPKKGDVATVAVYSLERDAALARLADLGWAIPPAPEPEPKEPEAAADAGPPDATAETAATAATDETDETDVPDEPKAAEARSAQASPPSTEPAEEGPEAQSPKPEAQSPTPDA